MACDSYDLAGFAFWAGLWAWVCVREWKKRCTDCPAFKPSEGE